MEGTNPLPFNTATINLSIGGESFDVVNLKGTEALSRPFRFDILALVNHNFDLVSNVKSKALLQLTGVDGIKRPIAGIITQFIEDEPHKDGQLKCKFILESNLRLLALHTDTRVILGHTLPNIVRDTCARHGIQTVFDLTRSYPIRPYVVQVNETDLKFIQRLLGKSGITFWSSSNPDEPDQEIIRFSDHNANAPYIKRNTIQFKKPTSLLQQYNSRDVHVGLHKMSVLTRQQTDAIAIHDWNDNTPDTKLFTTAGVDAYKMSQGFNPSLTTRFGLGSLALDETDQLTKQHAEHARCQSWNLEGHGNVIDMAVGHVFSLDAYDFNPDHSGDLIITSVSHQASQAAGLNLDGNEIAYRNISHCIKRETPYRPVIPAHPEIPMTFTARIESEGKYATLDANGRYKLRCLFDLSETKQTQASIPLRKLQPFGGPPSDSNVGMHMPLQDGDEVLLSCLNGDPDRPMIVASTYNSENINPVRSFNKHQNMIKTQADNAFIMDDKINHEIITLRTYEGYNIMRFNADLADHKILLETVHGAMNQYAKKMHKTETGDSIYERCGNERTEIIENKHRTQTLKGAIHHQAKTDIIENAYKNIKTKSGQNTEIRAGNNMIYNVTNNATFIIKGKDGFHAKVHNGELTINAAKEISITGNGGGDITFEQGGGGFKIDTAGNVKLYGNKVMLDGKNSLNLIGNVNYEIGTANIPPSPELTAIQLLTVVEAANDGKPFCEICERMKNKSPQ
ncbi:MAG: type VI secretion system Vgr family protein [Thiohalomonadales bacterium]